MNKMVTFAQLGSNMCVFFHCIGLLPAPGWKRENDWGPRVPFEQMPHSLNPKKGYVVSCNQRNIDKDYPYDLGQIYRQGKFAIRNYGAFPPAAYCFTYNIFAST